MSTSRPPPRPRCGKTILPTDHDPDQPRSMEKSTMSRQPAPARSMIGRLLLGACFVLGTARTAGAEIAVTSNDNKVTLDNGVIKVVKNPAPDTVSIIDMKTSPPKIIGEV